MLLDLRVPGLQVNDLVSFIRQASGLERVKVMIVNGDGNVEPPLGADGYISRPFSNEELVSRINQLLEPSYA